MNAELEGVWERMRDFGLLVLAHANRHAAYTDYANLNAAMSWDDMSIVQAAHAAELLIKARIAQEHPLLIFEQFPRSHHVSGSRLGIDDLFKRGKTVQWSELPERLWAVSGIVLPNLNRYEAFGRIRNGIQHFTPVCGDPNANTLRFVFEVIDPFINECWGLFAVDYDEEPEPYVYFAPTLIRNEIPFLVSPAAAESFNDWDFDWIGVSDAYRTELERRIEAALSQP